MKYFFFLACFLFLALSSQNSFAANDPSPAVGARAISLGFAYTGVRSDFWALFHNPAGIAGIEKTTVGAYVERRFNLKELTYGNAGVILPFLDNKHTAGIAFGSAGFDAYRENNISLAYATTLLERVSLGVNLKYTSVTILNYGQANNLIVDLGLNTRITDDLSVGFSATNVNRAELISLAGREDIPSVITAGVAYQPSENVFLVADVQKDVDHPVSFRGGIEYLFAENFFARLGVSTQPLAWSGGIGLKLKGFQCDFAFGYVDPLGYSPHVSMTYAF